MGKRSAEITVTPRQRVILKRVTRSKKAAQQLVERIEFEYHRHGTLSLIANFKEISEHGAILVRPDNHIAWRCLGAARDANYELEMALRTILAR